MFLIYHPILRKWWSSKLSGHWTADREDARKFEKIGPCKNSINVLFRNSKNFVVIEEYEVTFTFKRIAIHEYTPDTY